MSTSSAPLNGIKGNSEFLLETRLDEEQTCIANTTHESAGLLMSIANDVLISQRSNRGRWKRRLSHQHLRGPAGPPSSILETNRREPHRDGGFLRDSRQSVIRTDPYSCADYKQHCVQRDEVYLKGTRLCSLLAGMILKLISVKDTGIGMTRKFFQDCSRLSLRRTAARSPVGWNRSGSVHFKNMIELLRGDISATYQQGEGRLSQSGSKGDC